MALALRPSVDTNGANYGSTGATISFTPEAVGDLLLLHVANKLTTATPATPAGWTLLSQTTGGAGTDASGDGLGPVKNSVYYLRATSTAASSVTVSVPGGSSLAMELTSWYSTVGGLAVPDLVAVGSDTSVNTGVGAVSCTFSTTVAVNVSHKILVFYGVGSFIPGNSSWSNLALTATGATFSSFSGGDDYRAATTTGRDVSAFLFHGNVNSGTASAAATFAGDTSGGYTAHGRLTLVALAEQFLESDTGTFTESASVSVPNPTDGDTGSFTETENVTYVNTNRVLSDGDVGSSTEGLSANTQQSDSDTAVFSEAAASFIDPPSIVFNYSLTNPGYDIRLSGLIDGAVAFTKVSVLRRDPLGRYPEGYVRGMHLIDVLSDVAVGSDYEAPLGIPLDYYIELVSGSGSFSLGPIAPTPTYIPTQPLAYGRGAAYLKSVENPLVARAVMIESMPSWRRSVNVLAEHHILGRSNPVVITDVLGSRKGSFKLNVLMPEGQEIDEVYALLASGGVMLLQNNNYVVSGFKDLFFRVTGDVEIERRNLMVSFGAQETSHLQDVVITVAVEFTEVDRPDTIGVAVGNVTWQDVLTSQTSWANTNTNNDDWTDVTD